MTPEVEKALARIRWCSDNLKTTFNNWRDLDIIEQSIRNQERRWSEAKRQIRCRIAGCLDTHEYQRSYKRALQRALAIMEEIESTDPPNCWTFSEYLQMIHPRAIQRR